MKFDVDEWSCVAGQCQAFWAAAFSHTANIVGKSTLVSDLQELMWGFSLALRDIYSRNPVGRSTCRDNRKWVKGADSRIYSGELLVNIITHPTPRPVDDI